MSAPPSATLMNIARIYSVKSENKCRLYNFFVCNFVSKNTFQNIVCAKREKRPTVTWITAIVAADPIAVSVPLDFNNSGTSAEMIGFTQATVIMTGQATGGLPPLPFVQRFSLGAGYMASPGLSSKTFLKVNGSGNPGTVTDPMQYCNQTFTLTLILDNGQYLFRQGTAQCVF